jgi:hypothetical protein
MLRFAGVHNTYSSRLLVGTLSEYSKLLAFRHQIFSVFFFNKKAPGNEQYIQCTVSHKTFIAASRGYFSRL